ncbi:recombination protein RecO [Hydrogenimonas sp.]
MQGYILNIQRAKNEDTIVTILSHGKLKTLYRFYGARHPIVTAGFKIDFEIERDGTPFMPRLRNVVHLGFSWLKESGRLQVWQHFCSLLYGHLRDVELPGNFYFDLLERYATIWHLQNPKRSAIEAYAALLAHEGRLHVPTHCFACGGSIEKEVSLVRAYLPSHPSCAVGLRYRTDKIAALFETLSTIHMEDEDIEGLWTILLQGM